MIGNGIRLVLFAAWVMLTGWYVARQVAPDMGLVTESDPKASLAARLNKVQHYVMLWRPQPTHAAQKVGTCSLGATTDDVGVRMETQIDITNTRFLPGERLLRQALDGRARSGVRLRMDELLDANMRLRRVEIAGNVFGTAFNAEGPVDHRGLSLTWTAAGSSGSRLIPEVRPQRLAGGELSAGLPAGLAVGSRFTTRISSIDPARLKLATKEAVFVVTGMAHMRTAAGETDLLEVEMSLDGRRMAVLHSDRRGAVHRQELLDAGIILELTHVTDQFGRQIWPAPTTPHVQIEIDGPEDGR
ncbi:MAG: hypothetical protein J0M02_13115 [Planctomycetes bacterium]|nr:hypothetical protein [Planctomycetota bacterium]